jgi:hypothetical protein
MASARSTRAVLTAAATLTGTALATLAATLVLFGGAHATAADGVARPCAPTLPPGASERSAEAVVELFLRTAVVQRTGARTALACRASNLLVPRLKHARYATRFPGRLQGWYQLAPKIRNARGLWEYAGFLHVSAPQTAPAAYEFVLELHANRWLVSSFQAAPGAAAVDFANAPS